MMPASASTFTMSPREMAFTAFGALHDGQPRVDGIAVEDAQLLAMITSTPAALMAMGACSRELPQPKVLVGRYDDVARLHALDESEASRSSRHVSAQPDQTCQMASRNANVDDDIAPRNGARFLWKCMAKLPS